MSDKQTNQTDCGCGHKDCNCGDNCTCTPEDNCGCDCNQNDCGCGHKDCDCGDNCTCTKEDNCGCDCNQENHECHCHEHDQECHCKDGDHDCGCHGEHNHEHSHGGKKHTHAHEHGEHDHCHCHSHEDEYQQMFTQLQLALIEGEKQLTKARNEAMDNQRIAVSYKKDLERYKERNANIEVEAQNNAVENVASKLVPILDQFESALNATQSSVERKGFEMIYAGLKRAVADLGIVEIEALGAEFDSNYHNAVNKVKVDKKQKDGTVTAVYQKGYILLKTNKVIRYAMVEIGEYIK